MMFSSCYMPRLPAHSVALQPLGGTFLRRELTPFMFSGATTAAVETVGRKATGMLSGPGRSRDRGEGALL